VTLIGQKLVNSLQWSSTGKDRYSFEKMITQPETENFCGVFQ